MFKSIENFALSASLVTIHTAVRVVTETSRETVYQLIMLTSVLVSGAILLSDMESTQAAINLVISHIG